MANRDYFSQAYPDFWQILGAELLPFSLGHYFKLRRLDCAFVCDSVRPATMYDLLMGVAVCHMPSDPDPAADPFWQWFYGKGKAPLLLRARNLAMGILGKQKLAPNEWDMLRWGASCKAFDFNAKAQMFADYIKAHSKVPGFWESPDQSGQQSGAHWSHGVMATLVSKCGYTLEVAYNAPIGKALFDFYKAAENEGVGRIMTEEELAITEAQHGA